MYVSNAQKYLVCEKYRVYLEIMYFFGNKVMLLKQLYQYAETLGVAKNFSGFYSSMLELVNAEILLKEPFVAFGKKTQLVMLTLRKFAIRFLENKDRSYDVASVPRAITNERILVSLYKNCYIHSKIVPRIIKKGCGINFSTIVETLNQDYSTILLGKNEGAIYLSELINSQRMSQYLNVEEIKHAVKRLKEIEQRRTEGLKKGSESTQGKGTGGKLMASVEDKALESVVERYNHDNEVGKIPPKITKLDHYSIDTMLSFNAHIAQIKPIQNRLQVTVLIFDINDKQDIYRSGTHIACIYNMLARYFSVPITLKVGVVCVDEMASSSVKAASEALVRDFISKEIKGTRLSTILNEWRVDRVMQNHIEVHFTDYDITNQYLDGIKRANLLRR